VLSTLRAARAERGTVSALRVHGLGGSVAVLAGVVSLVGIDQGTLSVNAGTLEHAFGVGHTEIGLLASVTTLTGAAFILPVGMLTDRVNRTRLLGGSIVLWAVAVVFSALAPDFGTLIAARTGLAAVTCTAGPTVASLLGDLAPARRRARLYSWVLIGEIVGNGVGLLVSSGLAAALSWRISLGWPALPALGTAWLVTRLREPERGGEQPEQPAGCPLGGTEARSRIAEIGGRRVPLRTALGYVLRTRTAVIMIIASALGYFFLAGVRTFAVVFATEHYGITRGDASGFAILIGAGGVAGYIVGGRIPDLLARRNVRAPRVWCAAAAYLAAPLALAPGIATTRLWAAIPLLLIGTALIAAANPPVDAVRLDVIPARLWGRAEAVRSALRSGGESAAPVLFGYLSSGVFHGPEGLTDAFLVCLAPLGMAGALTLRAVRSYPSDSEAAERSTSRRESTRNPAR
jgi:predicted MFS family arabinose efflux permease